MVRIGRTLFRAYIEPLRPASIEKTLDSARKSLLLSQKPSANSNHEVNSSRGHSLQQQVILLLDRKILPVLRSELQRGVWSLESRGEDVSDDIPCLAKYLLLAAFLCNHNRPDRDKYLFSIQKNGKRRRGQGADGYDEEEIAFGPGSQQRPKVFRPKTFPMERMLSVFVSMVGLNHSSTSSIGDDDERLRSLGGSAFYENLAQLCDMGLLHEYPARSDTDAVRLSEPRFWTPITMEDAQAIAASMAFPLDRYII